MMKFELTIYSQPADGEDWRSMANPPLLAEYGGRFRLPGPAVLDQIDELARAQRLRSDATIGVAHLNVAAIAEVVRLAPEGPDSSLRLRARWKASPDGDVLPDVEILASDSMPI